MLKFYYHPTPNPAKVALFLEESGLPFELVPVDTMKGEQHSPAFRAINPNGKLPAIDDDGVKIFDSTAILLYLGDKTGQFMGKPADRGELLSWLMFIATGLGPFSGQSVHFRHFAPEPKDYALNRYTREIERHYGIVDARLADGRTYLVGDAYTIVDIAAWGWIDRMPMVLGDDGFDAYPNMKRWFDGINARPAVERARAVGTDHPFKSNFDEEARRAYFPQNYAKDSAA